MFGVAMLALVLFSVRVPIARAGGAPVIDVSHIGTTVAVQATERVEKLADVALEKFLLAALELAKKRLLDTLVDQIVNWIQNGEEPRFIQDFGSVLRDAGDAAFGDTLRQVGLADFCSPFQKGSIRLQLEKPQQFSKQVSCTLSQVISNVKAFEKDFSAGGFIGYTEVFKPQNNIYLSRAIVEEKLTRNIAERTEAAKQETQASQGFLAVRQCVEWTLVEKATGGQVKPGASNNYLSSLVSNPRKVDDSFSYDDEREPPPLDTSTGVVGNPNAVEWQCTKTLNTTPGTAIAEGLNRSLFSDLDFLASANEISAYIAAIADAAINRLIKEGVKGFANIAKSQTTNPTPTRPPTINLSTSTRDATREYASTSQYVIDRSKREYLDEAFAIGRLVVTANRELERARNETIRVIATANDLFSCADQKRFQSDIVWASSTIRTATTTTVAAIVGIHTSLENTSSSLYASIAELNSSSLDPRTADQIKTRLKELRNQTNADTNTLRDLIETIVQTARDAENRLLACRAAP